MGQLISPNLNWGHYSWCFKIRVQVPSHFGWSKGILRGFPDPKPPISTIGVTNRWSSTLAPLDLYCKVIPVMMRSLSFKKPGVLKRDAMPSVSWVMIRWLDVVIAGGWWLGDRWWLLVVDDCWLLGNRWQFGHRGCGSLTRPTGWFFLTTSGIEVCSLQPDNSLRHFACRFFASEKKEGETTAQSQSGGGVFLLKRKVVPKGSVFTHPKTIGWKPKMKVWFRWFSILKGFYAPCSFSGV